MKNKFIINGICNGALASSLFSFRHSDHNFQKPWIRWKQTYSLRLHAHFSDWNHSNWKFQVSCLDGMWWIHHVFVFLNGYLSPPTHSAISLWHVFDLLPEDRYLSSVLRSSCYYCVAFNPWKPWLHLPHMPWRKGKLRASISGHSQRNEDMEFHIVCYYFV